MKLNDKSLKKHIGGACEIEKKIAEIEYKDGNLVIKKKKKVLAVKKPKIMFKEENGNIDDEEKQNDEKIDKKNK